MKSYVSLVLAAWFVSSALAAFSQVPPNAGSLQQNIENSLRQNPLPYRVAPKLFNESIVTPNEGVSFNLKRIVFSGNTLLSNSQVEQLTAPYVYRDIYFSQLHALANDLEEAYRRLGRLARVIIPEQQISDQTLRILIEESNLGEIKVQGNPKRVKPEQISKTVAGTQNNGQLMNVGSLERGVLLADDLPGVAVGAVLTQGGAPLITDLLVNAIDEPMYYGSVQTDNLGPTSIGANRFIGNLNVNSPLGVGDLLSGVYLATSGSNYERLSYSLPVGFDGLRLGINGSAMSYKLVSGQFQSLGATGQTSTGGLEALYPIIRSKLTNLYFGANADYRAFNNSNAPSAVLSKYLVTDYSASLFLSTQDLVGSATNNLNIVVINGNTNLNGSPNQLGVISTNNAQGSFTKTRYTANRTLTLDTGFSAYANVTGQATGANLDSSEMFYLGGMNGVRAYPTNEGAGSQGEIVTLELRKLIAQNTNIALFYDYGHVQVNPNNAYVVIGVLNSYDQKGAGLSVGLKPTPKFDIKAVWAKRMGTDTNLTSTGTYQNGSTGSTQLWLFASLGF
jgi:hemolysin activation/secretion protein